MSHTIVSVKFGALRFAGCDKHPDGSNTVCAGIRQADGTRLTTAQIWEVMNELAAGMIALATPVNALDASEKRG